MSEPTASPPPPLLQSSVDPAKLALTVRGILVLAGPMVVILAKALGLDFGESQMAQLTEAIVAAVSLVAILVGGGMVAWGMVRKALWPESTSALKKIVKPE